MHDDPWIKFHSPIAPEKLHALGYINLVWNVTEYWLTALLASLAGIGENACRVFIYDLGDVSIANRIEAFAARRNDLSEKQRVAVDHALKSYDICRLNRNLYNHYTLSGGSRD